MGWPIVGDGKYGRKNRDNKRLALHSHILSFDHPFSGKRVTFKAPVPATFYKMAAAPEPEPPKEEQKRKN
jgi:23S rRNA pseudouridine1911/1915/1917 synthase